MSILSSTHAGAKSVLFKRDLRAFAEYALYIKPFTNSIENVTRNIMWSTITFYSQKHGFHCCHLFTYCLKWKIEEFEQHFIDFVKNSLQYYHLSIDDVIFPKAYIDPNYSENNVL